MPPKLCRWSEKHESKSGLTPGSRNNWFYSGSVGTSPPRQTHTTWDGDTRSTCILQISSDISTEVSPDCTAAPSLKAFSIVYRYSMS